MLNTSRYSGRKRRTGVLRVLPGFLLLAGPLARGFLESLANSAGCSLLVVYTVLSAPRRTLRAAATGLAVLRC